MTMTVWLLIVAILAITIVTCVAVIMGFDNVLVTGATSAIVGIAAGVGAYYKGKSKGASEKQNGDK